MFIVNYMKIAMKYNSVHIHLLYEKNLALILDKVKNKSYILF